MLGPNAVSAPRICLHALTDNIGQDSLPCFLLQERVSTLVYTKVQQQVSSLRLHMLVFTIATAKKYLFEDL